MTQQTLSINMSAARQAEQENYMHYIVGSEASASRSNKTNENYMHYIGGSDDSEAEPNDDHAGTKQSNKQAESKRIATSG